jgi:hypothetical protein
MQPAYHSWLRAGIEQSVDVTHYKKYGSVDAVGPLSSRMVADLSLPTGCLGRTLRTG